MERSATFKLVCVKLPVNRLSIFNSVFTFIGYCLSNSKITSFTKIFSKELSLFTQVGAFNAKGALTTNSLFSILT